jgi:hypothetical protein
MHFGGWEMRLTRKETRSGWRHGPSWGAVVLVLVVLGLTTIMLGFGTSLYVETGARYVCGGTWPESLEGQPPVELEEPVTAKIDVACGTPDARLYTFIGSQREAARWAEQTLNRIAAEREVPALRSEMNAISLRLVFAGLGFLLTAVALGVWRAIVRTTDRRDEATPRPRE